MLTQRSLADWLRQRLGPHAELTFGRSLICASHDVAHESRTGQAALFALCSAIGLPDHSAGYVYDHVVDALELRFIVYRHFVETGSAPTRRTLNDFVGDLETTDLLLHELHERHMLVLDDRPSRRGEIRMALPFAATPTNFRVTTDHGAWWANCAWDSLAILAALHSDGRVHSTWSDTEEPVELTVTHGQLDDTDGYISFPLPAIQWWDDIVFT